MREKPIIDRLNAEVRKVLARADIKGSWKKQGLQGPMPSLERIRFTASGTEATHMAIRLARAFTGKPKLMRFRTMGLELAFRDVQAARFHPLQENPAQV